MLPHYVGTPHQGQLSTLHLVTPSLNHSNTYSFLLLQIGNIKAMDRVISG